MQKTSSMYLKCKKHRHYYYQYTKNIYRWYIPHDFTRHDSTQEPWRL